MIAASSSSAGIAEKNWRNRNTRYGEVPSPHSTQGQYVLTSPTRENSTYVGITVSTWGSIMVDSTTTNSDCLPGPRSLAKPNPTTALAKVTSTAYRVDRNSELAKYAGKLMAVNAWVKLDHCGCSG